MEYGLIGIIAAWSARCNTRSKPMGLRPERGLGVVFIVVVVEALVIVMPSGVAPEANASGVDASPVAVGLAVFG